MGAKKNKAKNLSISKSEGIRRRRWPWSDQLPPNLPLVERHRWHMRYHSTSPGIIKSWLSPTRRCDAMEQHQWRRLYHLNDSSKNALTSNYPHNCFLGDSSIPVAVSQRPNASYWSILEVDTTNKICPTSTPSSNQAVTPGLVWLAGIPSTTLIARYTIYSNISSYSYSYDYVSIRYQCTTIDPFDAKKKHMEFTSIVGSEDKYYALSLQGTLAVMQNVDSRLRITTISTSRAVPSVSSRFFKEYLVEMNGEIMLVFLIHQESLRVVDQVEVFRLGFHKLDWIKVERLPGKTLFLDQRCIWANSAEIDCRENCIYFTQGSDNTWWIYDMESCCFSPA